MFMKELKCSHIKLGPNEGSVSWKKKIEKKIFISKTMHTQKVDVRLEKKYSQNNGLLDYGRFFFLPKSLKDFSCNKRVSNFLAHIMNLSDNLNLLTSKVYSWRSRLASALCEQKLFACFGSNHGQM